MKVHVRYVEEIAIVEVEGKVNINSSKLIETVGSLIESGTTKIIVDMENVDFIDYNGLSVLAIAYKSVLNRKGTMKLCCVSLHIMELLRIVKLDEVFEIEENVKDALLSFEQGASRSKEEVLEQPLRRRFKRLEMDIPVHYKLTHRLTPRGEAELYSGRIANISGAGTFVRTIDILPAGSRVELEISFGRHKSPGPLKGMVLWVADKGLQPDLYPGMGIAFVELSPRGQEEIIEFVEKNIVHRKG